MKTVFKVMLTTSESSKEIGTFNHPDAACFFRDKLGKALNLTKNGVDGPSVIWQSIDGRVSLSVTEDQVSMIDELCTLILKVELA